MKVSRCITTYSAPVRSLYNSVSQKINYDDSKSGEEVVRIKGGSSLVRRLGTIINQLAQWWKKHFPFIVALFSAALGLSIYGRITKLGITKK